MKHNAFSKLLCLLLAVLLLTALTGCADTPATPASSETPVSTAAPETGKAPETTAAPETSEQPAPPETSEQPVPPETADATEAGEGARTIYLDVTFSSLETTRYAIRTDAETVGEALSALGLIAGQETEYGLMVDTVCGEQLVWDDCHMYWAFYINGEYAMTGVDNTPLEDGATYGFVATAG